MPSFPASLPLPQADPYELAALEQTIRTEMEVGAPRARRRTKARLDRLTLEWILTDAQMIVWRAWFDAAVYGASGGASWITMNLAFGDGGIRTREVRFLGRWSARPISGLTWRVRAECEARGGELTVDQQRGAIAGLVFDGVYPSLYLDFTDEVLDSRISYSRSGTKLYVGANGKYAQAAANVWPREYDPYSLICVGRVVEETRTNHIAYSNDYTQAAWTKVGCTVTANAAASPMAGVNACLIKENTANSQHGIEAGVSGLADNTVYTLSVCYKPAGRAWLHVAALRKDGTFAGANFNCSGAGSVGGTSNVISTNIVRRVDGYYRCEVTYNSLSGASSPMVYLRLLPGDTGTTYTGDGVSGGYAWGAQVEAGAEATSPIITAGSAVTRATDDCRITGANFSSFFNASEGTFFVDAKTDRRYGGANTYPVAVSVSDGSANNFIAIAHRVTSTYTDKVGSVRRNGVSECDITTNQHETTTKWAFAYKANDCAFAGRGTLIGTDTSVTLPTVSELGIGSLGGINFFNGPIKQIVYWPTRLANNYAQAPTQ